MIFKTLAERRILRGTKRTYNALTDVESQSRRKMSENRVIAIGKILRTSPTFFPRHRSFGIPMSRNLETTSETLPRNAVESGNVRRGNVRLSRGWT